MATKEYYSNEYYTVTVDRIIMLMEVIAILESRYQDHNSEWSTHQDHNSDYLRTAVNVLRSRVNELKGKVHD